MGVRPGDHVALVLFTFRGPTYGLFQGARHDPDPVRLRPGRDGALLRAVAPVPADRPLQLRLGAHQRGARRVRTARLRPARRVRVVQGRRVRGRAAEPARACARGERGASSCSSTRGVGDVTAAFECRAHDGLHVWEDTVVRRGPRSRRHATGRRRRTLRAGRDVVVQPHRAARPVPLRRHRAPHAATPCVCGRTHARVWPIGRKGDEIVVDGRPVLPIDVWAAVESVDACAMGLFQVIRTGPRGRHAAAARRLRARVRGAAGDRSRDDVRGRGARGDRRRTRSRARARTRRCSSSVRRTRSRGWRSDDRTTTTAAGRRGVGSYDDGTGRVAVGDLARRDPTRHRRRRPRALAALGVARRRPRAVLLDARRRRASSGRSSSARCWPARSSRARTRTKARRCASRCSCGSCEYRRGARRDRRDPRRPRRARPSRTRDVFGTSASSVHARARTSASRRAGSRRITSSLCGPAVAIGPRARRLRRRVDADEWRLDARRRRRVLVTSLQPARDRRSFAPPTAVRGTLVDGGIVPDIPERRQSMTKRALISADNHVFEPVTLWQERLPEEFRERGPRLEQRGDWFVMAIEGMPDRKLTRADGGSCRTARPSSRIEIGMRAGGADPDARLQRHGARRRRRRGDLSDVRLVHRHDPGAPICRWRARRSTTTGSRRRSCTAPTCSSPPRSCRSAMSRRRRPSSNASSGSGSRPRRSRRRRPAGMPYNQPSFDPLWKIAADARDPAVAAHRHRRAAAARARAGRRGHQLREGRAALGRDALLLRRVGRARAVPRPAPRVRRDRRGLARVLLRAHGRSVRGARAVGEPEARATAVGIRAAGSASSRSAPIAHRCSRARSPVSARCCGRATTRTPRARSPRVSRSSSASSPACPKPTMQRDRARQRGPPLRRQEPCDAA